MIWTKTAAVPFWGIRFMQISRPLWGCKHGTSTAEAHHLSQLISPWQSRHHPLHLPHYLRCHHHRHPRRRQFLQHPHFIRPFPRLSSVACAQFKTYSVARTSSGVPQPMARHTTPMLHFPSVTPQAVSGYRSSPTVMGREHIRQHGRLQ
jgi:hypothetical protein